MILKSEHEGTKQVMHLIKETYSLQISRVESCKYGNISLEGLVSPCSNGTLHTVKIPVIIVAIFIKGVQKEKKQFAVLKTKTKRKHILCQFLWLLTALFLPLEDSSVL